MKLYEEYLTEKKLGFVLSTLYQKEFIHDKKVPDSYILNRPDYRNEKLKLIVEFDGIRHFTNPTTIVRDIKKDTIYKEMGYKVVRIPYFIQLNKIMINHYFNLKVDYDISFKQGFINNDIILPAEYCGLGVNRFKEIMKNIPSIIYKEILLSLYNKYESLNVWFLVFPVEDIFFYKEQISNIL